MRLITATVIWIAMAACLADAGFAAEPALWVETSGTMILSNRTEGATKEIVLTGVRNEYVSAQLALRSGEDAVQPFSFEWTALNGPDGKEIPKNNVTLFRGADISVTFPAKENKSKDAARSRPYGMFPDALIPLVTRDGINVANSIKPEKDKTVEFWVDILIPAGSPAGLYTGSITLKADGKSLAVPVKLTVVNVEIPAESTIPSLYNLRDHKHILANLDAYVAEIMAHRVQPTNYRYVTMDPKETDRYNPNGKGYVSLMYADAVKPTPEREKQIIDSLKTITAHLKERKLFDNSFLQLKDEPRPGDYPGMIEMAKLIIRELPEWKDKITDTLGGKDELELSPYIFHDVRPLSQYGPWRSSTKYDGREEWDKRRADGHQVWFYVSNCQGTPYPTFDVNTVDVAFEARILPWAWWFEKAYGHLYYDLVHEETWVLPAKLPPGDGWLLYPGDFSLPGAPSWTLVKDIKGPVISRRLKLLRNGIQEWEMLRMAEKKVGREKVQALVSPIYTSMGTKWSYDEAEWEKARAEVIKLLE